jgi:ribosomal protein S21
MNVSCYMLALGVREQHDETLQESRPEYKGFKRDKFKDRIHQEVRRQKFINYLDSKRSKKFEERKRGQKDVIAHHDNAMDES